MRRPGVRFRSERCIYRASRPSQGTVNGDASLNDLAVDGTLNTTNQPTVIDHLHVYETTCICS